MPDCPEIEIFAFPKRVDGEDLPPVSLDVLDKLSSVVADDLAASNSDVISPSAHVVRKKFKVLNKALDLKGFRQSKPLVDFEDQNAVELVFLPSSDKPRTIQLAVFDLDSTLIYQEVIDELARSIGKTDAVSAITERAMRGELDFAESLRERAKMLKGVRADVWISLRSVIVFVKGAKELCHTLHSKGVKMAVLSGGFQPMAEWVKGQLKLDVAVANHLVVSGPTEEFPFEHLTGELSPDHPIITATSKKELVESLSKEHSIPLSQAMVVGDGANDLEMLNLVGNAGGVAIACRAKPKVQKESPNRLNTGDLEDLLQLFEF